MSLHEYYFEREGNPLDVIEHVASRNDWSFERSTEDEIALLITGMFAEYSLSFSWMNEIESLHLACSFGMRVPVRRRAETYKLLAIINQQLVTGHFDLWINDGLVVFRMALPLQGGAEANDAQVHYLLAGSLEACERYYQAFQFVVWAGKPASRALEDTLFETVGEA